MKTVVCGKWNKHSSARKEAQQLWKTRNLYDEGKATLKELRETEDALVVVLLGELEQANASIIGDGCIRWDSIFDIMRNIPGCGEFRQLTRIPKTNHFHRQATLDYPNIQKAISEFRCGSLVGKDLAFAKEHTNLPIAMSLPGPYSCAKQTRNISEKELCNAASFYATILNYEILYLLSMGAEMICIEEPILFENPEDFELFFSVSEQLTKHTDISKVALMAWFEDISSFPEYFRLPFGMFLVDFVEYPTNIALLKNFPPKKKLVAGLFEARHTYEEPSSVLAKKLNEIVSLVPEENVLISANAPLHFLPWDEAIEKVKNMASFAVHWKKILRKTPPQKQKTRGGVVALRSCFGKETASDLNAEPKKNFSFGAYPTSTVGSLPQPQELRTARALLKEGRMNPKDYEKLVEKHTREWIKFQEEIDITVVVSGEFARQDMAAYFGVHFGGTLLDFVPSYENRRYRPVEYAKKIYDTEKDSLAKEFLSLQALTSKPVKITITGPATLADWAILKNGRYYQNRLVFRMELAEALREKIARAISAGTSIVQLDEPALTTKLETLEMDLLAIEETLRGVSENAYTILHICYSDSKALEKAFPSLLYLPVNQIHMEMANRNYSLFRLVEQYGFAEKDIGLGVIDVHTDRMESREEIVAAVQKARLFFQKEQIWLTPDCGLKERRKDIVQEKLRILTQTADWCRKNLP